MNIWTENKCYDVFLMRYLDGLTFKAIGKNYNISGTRARYIIQNTKRILRKKYKVKIKIVDNGEY